MQIIDSRKWDALCAFIKHLDSKIKGRYFYWSYFRKPIEVVLVAVIKMTCPIFQVIEELDGKRFEDHGTTFILTMALIDQSPEGLVFRTAFVSQGVIHPVFHSFSSSSSFNKSCGNFKCFTLSY